MEKVVIWLHEEHLSAQNPAMTEHPDAPVIFVFDEDFLTEAQFAFHRLFFIYESVINVFGERGGICSVRRGRVVEEVPAFAKAHGAARIITTQAPGDRFADDVQEMQKILPIETIIVPQLVPYDAQKVPRRFSAWWREVGGGG